MKKCLVLFLVCATYLNATPFYQNPSPEAAYQWIQAQEIEQIEEKERPFVLSLATTFITQIIKLHPDYIEPFAQNFANLSPQEKIVFFQAFSTIGIQDSRVQGEEFSQIISPSKLNTRERKTALDQEFKTAFDFDFIVVSFLATGDPLFLSQPMAFLNSDPELLFFVYEWNNRQALSKLAEELTGQSKLPDESEFLDTLHSWSTEKQIQFVLRLTAWQCLDFIREEDPTAAEKISQLCKTDPALDYQGTLQTLLN